MREFKIGSILLLILILATYSVQAATVEIISIHSKKMGKNIPATLILPEAYKQSTQRFSVMYLLHGARGNYKNWHSKTDIAKLADTYGIIVLCPDGGGTSWYFDSPIDPKYQYETFVAEDCVEYIDNKYRSKAHRNYRAICGLSMGGHGAMFLAIRHKDVFSIAVTLSGDVDIRSFPNKWGIKRRIGDLQTHKENWDKYTVINLAKGLKDGELAISLDCGTEDYFLGVNRSLHNQLLKDGITHKYVEHPGGHKWKYWKEAIKRQLPFIDKHFRKPQKTGTPNTYEPFRVNRQ